MQIFPPQMLQEAIDGIDAEIAILKKYNITGIRLGKAHYNNDDTCDYAFDETIDIDVSSFSIFKDVENIAREIFVARLESQKRNLKAHLQNSEKKTDGNV